MRIKIEKFDIKNEDMVWENFMAFARKFIPWEEQLNDLTEEQKYPMYAFIYEAEVMGDGHISFMELYRDYIKIDDVIAAFQKLDISREYIENLSQFPKEYISTDMMFEKAADEEDYTLQMEKLDEIYEVYDRKFYSLGNEEIVEKITKYVQEHYMDFFEFSGREKC